MTDDRHIVFAMNGVGQLTETSSTQQGAAAVWSATMSVFTANWPTTGQTPVRSRSNSSTSAVPPGAGEPV